MPAFERDGLRFHYRDEGAGVPFVFQHGLGGDVGQPFGLYAPPPSGIRLIAFDARGHGETRPLGDPKKISLGDFADDLVGLLDDLGIEAREVAPVAAGTGKEAQCVSAPSESTCDGRANEAGCTGDESCVGHAAIHFGSRAYSPRGTA